MTTKEMKTKEKIRYFTKENKLTSHFLIGELFVIPVVILFLGILLSDGDLNMIWIAVIYSVGFLCLEWAIIYLIIMHNLVYTIIGNQEKLIRLLEEKQN